jgi:predicted ester cyclase
VVLGSGAGARRPGARPGFLQYPGGRGRTSVCSRVGLRRDRRGDLPSGRGGHHVCPAVSTPEQNKELVRRLTELVNKRDLHAVGEVAAGDIARAAKSWIGPFVRSFPDFHMRIVDLIAEDDKVAAHFHCSGTHEGEWRGVPPTGRRFEDVNEVYIFRVEGGRLVAATAVEDNLTRLQQLGIDP